MKFWATRYVIYLLIPIAVAAAWWWDSAEIARYQGAPVETASQPDYFLDNAEIWEFDERGNNVQHLMADRVQRFLARNVLQFDAPIVTSESALGNPWVISAEDGHSNDGGNTIQLNENVVMLREPSEQNSDFEMKTQVLLLNTQTNVATTQALVNVLDTQRRMSGMGLEADLNNETYHLMSEVKGTLWQ